MKIWHDLEKIWWENCPATLRMPSTWLFHGLVVVGHSLIGFGVGLVLEIRWDMIWLFHTAPTCTIAGFFWGFGYYFNREVEAVLERRKDEAPVDWVDGTGDTLGPLIMGGSAAVGLLALWVVL